jgi:hypothetical protein
MVRTEELRDLLTGRREWLLVRELGRSFPLYSSEIEIIEGRRTKFGFLDDKGFHSWRLKSFSVEGNEIVVDVAGKRSRRREAMRLVPRTPAAEVAAEIELARLGNANEIARLIADGFPGSRIGRVALNVENGRLAQIEFETADKQPMAAIADVTAALVPETVFASAILWLEHLGLRKKKPVSDLWIVCERQRARALQKLHALLGDRWKEKLTIISLDRRPAPPVATVLPKRQLRELWREKPQKLSVPNDAHPSATAASIIGLAHENIDVVFSRQGETLRFSGLPFARVRTVSGLERAWFGTGRGHRILTDDNWPSLVQLVELLKTNRSADAPNRRHDLYRAASEAWLESILRRNIGLLDANLILSPIYNQFRASRDKIDLLALRRDGRLVVIELKTQPDRASVLQTVDYWRKIELQRRRGILAAADLFAGRRILDKPALIYLAAPAWSFHRDFDFFARCISPEIELWRFELHQDWRRDVRVIARQSVATNL